MCVCICIYIYVRFSFAPYKYDHISCKLLWVTWFIFLGKACVVKYMHICIYIHIYTHIIIVLSNKNEETTHGCKKIKKKKFFFLLWATPSDAQVSLLVLYSEIIPGGARGTYGVPGIKPRWVMCKISTLLYCMFSPGPRKWMNPKGIRLSKRTQPPKRLSLKRR